MKLKVIEELRKLVDEGTTRNADEGFRNHLGASVIGHECARHVWYASRWVALEKFSGRMLRLFDRGNREEFVFEKILRDAGMAVVTIDPETGKQFRISDFGGLFGGSTDGMIWGLHLLDPQLLAMVGESWGLLEIKTHNDKSFKKLHGYDAKNKCYDERLGEGVAKSKPRHVAQMQTYMGYRGLKFALYCAVNKNDDELHFEIVIYDEAQALRWRMRADTVLNSKSPPAKISQSPAWFECKFCEFSDVCHRGALPLRNCRTCKHVVIDSVAGEWQCGMRADKALSKEEQEAACQVYEPNPLM